MFCIVDLETTSTDFSDAEILTGCFLAVDEKFNVLAEKEIKCRPWVWGNKAEEASKIHGITKDQVQNYPLFHDVTGDLFRWFYIYDFKHFVCHAKRETFGRLSTFDHMILRSALFPHDEYWKFQMIFPEHAIISTHSLALYLDSQYNFQGRSLKQVSDRLGIKLSNHHTAKDDAYCCYEIFKKLYPQVNHEEFINWDFYKLGGIDADFETTSRRNNKKARSGSKSFKQL